MTFDEIKAKMESHGFRFQPHSRGASDSSIGIFHRRTEVKRACLTNQNSQFVVEVFDRATFMRPTDPGFADRFGFEADITGEFVTDLWAKLRVYGVRPESFFEREKEIEAALVRAWEAMA